VARVAKHAGAPIIDYTISPDITVQRYRPRV
jgi:hypothetical protein